MGGVFGFFLGVTILNLLRQTWIYIGTFFQIQLLLKTDLCLEDQRFNDFDMLCASTN